MLERGRALLKKAVLSKFQNSCSEWYIQIGVICRSSIYSIKVHGSRVYRQLIVAVGYVNIGYKQGCHQVNSFIIVRNSLYHKRSKPQDLNM